MRAPVEAGAFARTSAALHQSRTTESVSASAMSFISIPARSSWRPNVLERDAAREAGKDGLLFQDRRGVRLPPVTDTPGAATSAVAVPVDQLLHVTRLGG